MSDDRLNKRLYRKRSKPKRDGDSKQYLSDLHSLPCCCCRTSGVQVHHLRGMALGRGLGLKSLDRYAIPLCQTCHDQIHESGTRLEAEILDDMARFCVLDMSNALWYAWQRCQSVAALEEEYYKWI